MGTEFASEAKKNGTTIEQHGFKQKATGPNTIEYKIGEIFGEIKNRIQSGYNLREIIDHIDELRFQSQTEKHELSHLYEAKIKNMGNGGEHPAPARTRYHPGRTCPKLDSRLRGNDGKIAALDAECAVVLNSIRKLL